jgi:ABC-type antimicrobial peptide transport system permease subunit
LLVSEENLLRHFPSREGYSFFLVDLMGVPPERGPELATALESSLGDFGFDTTTTGDRLARYSAVRNTYISTFQSLGALGLLLGTVGLAVILLRNVLERRGELAAMRAFGFRRRRLSRMVLAENAFVLLLGILLGSGAALLAVAPYLTAVGGGEGAQVPWVSLLITLVAIAAVGILACAWAASRALRAHLLPALKGL